MVIVTASKIDKSEDKTSREAAEFFVACEVVEGRILFYYYRIVKKTLNRRTTLHEPYFASIFDVLKQYLTNILQANFAKTSAYNAHIN